MVRKKLFVGNDVVDGRKREEDEKDRENGCSGWKDGKEPIIWILFWRLLSEPVQLTVANLMFSCFLNLSTYVGGVFHYYLVLKENRVKSKCQEHEATIECYRFF
jgi:hypothetical protein